MKTSKDKEEYTPFLTDEMVEAQVKEDLRKYQKTIGKTLSFPLYPEEMMKALWGVVVEERERVLSPDGEEVLACFSPDEKKVYLNISMSGNEGRISFTLAHEMGHVSLHNFLSKTEAGRVLCRGALTQENKAQMLERQADKYASMLLMPKEIILEQLTQIGYVPTEKLNLNLHAQSLKDYFGVSHEALERRLSDIGVVTEGGFYKVKLRKIPESFYQEKEVERQGWDMRKRGGA